jgi:hypothetical protein
VLTVIESPLFTRIWPDYWCEDERGEFSAWLAKNPTVGDLVPGSGGVRKVRWANQAQGKRSGVRIIYCAFPARGYIWLLTIYAKSDQETIPAHLLKLLKEKMSHAND